MNLVFLSPHFPPNFENFCLRLRELGGTVLGIADAPWDDLTPQLRHGLSEYYRCDLNDYDQLVRALGYFTHRHGRLSRIESHNEFWLETEARLRLDFHLVGPSPAEVASFTLKSRMKEVFRAAGVAVAPGAVVHTLAEADSFAAQTGYPLIAKPDRGVGAADTRKLSNRNELADFFSRKPPCDYLLEGFVRGELHSFDGLVDHRGEVVFCASHVFSQGIMETVNEDRDLFYYSQRAIPADLETAGRRVVAAYGLREKFFHLEFFRTPAGELVGIEVNMRPPGGLTMDMFNYANDIDLYREWAKVVLGKGPPVEYQRPWHCAYAGRKAGKGYRLGHGQLLGELGALIVHHEPISSTFRAALGDYGYLLRAPQLDTLLAAGHLIQQPC